MSSNLEKLRIYTMIPLRTGHIGKWQEMLYYIDDLGFNTLHILPITKMGASESPYAAKDLMEIDEWYAIPGDKREIQKQFEEDFIGTAKVLDIRLCFDLVLNHIGTDSEMIKNNPGWIKKDKKQKDGFKRAGYWDFDKWKIWDELCLIDYDHSDKKVRQKIWKYMKDYVFYWAKYAAMTKGLVRFDNLHSSDPKFIKYLTKELKKEYPQLLFFGELFVNKDKIEKKVKEYQLDLLLGTPWGEKYVPGLRKYFKKIHKNFAKMPYTTTLNSHDCGTPAEEFGNVTSTVPRYVTMALCGTPFTGLSEGAEIGMPEKVHFIGKKDGKEIDLNAPYTDYRGFIKKINFIQENNPVFNEPGNLRFIDVKHKAIIGVYRKSKVGEGKDFLIVSNFDINSPQEIAINIKGLSGKKARVTELISGKSLELPKKIKLKPSEAKVFMI